MGNSAPYIKEIADVVVGTNNENGVAEALNKVMQMNRKIKNGTLE